ncbi:MAG: hypothetical protein RR091_10820 [Cloacibacillus sp.]
MGYKERKVKLSCAISPEVHRAFVIAVAYGGTNTQGVLERAVMDYIKACPAASDMLDNNSAAISED